MGVAGRNVARLGGARLDEIERFVVADNEGEGRRFRLVARCGPRESDGGASCNRLMVCDGWHSLC